MCWGDLVESVRFCHSVVLRGRLPSSSEVVMGSKVIQDSKTTLHSMRISNQTYPVATKQFYSAKARRGRGIFMDFFKFGCFGGFLLDSRLGEGDVGVSESICIILELRAYWER